VLYISRIPPNMKPAKLRQLLSEQGDIQRLYCAPEDASARRARKQRGGNTGKMFTEGWVEFADKRVAKQARHAHATAHFLYFSRCVADSAGAVQAPLQQHPRRRPPLSWQLADAVARLLPTPHC
jgi:hypothetical protein